MKHLGSIYKLIARSGILLILFAQSSLFTPLLSESPDTSSFKLDCTLAAERKITVFGRSQLKALENQLREVNVDFSASGQEADPEYTNEILEAFYQNDSQLIERLGRLAAQMRSMRAPTTVATDSENRNLKFGRLLRISFQETGHSVERDPEGVHFLIGGNYAELLDVIEISVGFQKSEELSHLSPSQILERQISLAEALFSTKDLPPSLDTIHLLGGKPTADSAIDRGIRAEEEVLALSQKDFDAFLNYLNGRDLNALFKQTDRLGIYPRGIVLGGVEDIKNEYNLYLKVENSAVDRLPK